ncbi:DUF3761 domain-containing protein [Cryptosporangium phraense]|uniref:DUF3761 domain-containing protein n=1 Tax=Cryptosporangium phraense TaxID=2593070 RepID=A0A545AIG9_9ACTN|nr:DUF3761 domain-containing protein [Cryptosporangium phraense]
MTGSRPPGDDADRLPVADLAVGGLAVQDLAVRNLAVQDLAVEGLPANEPVVVDPPTKRPAPGRTTAAARPPADDYSACGGDYYVNSNGNCVHRPGSEPARASAQCEDGSYSYSQHRQGTCSGHGGVRRWL